MVRSIPGSSWTEKPMRVDGTASGTMPKPIRVSARVAIPKNPEAPILARTSEERGTGAAKSGSSDWRSRSPAVTSMAMGIPPVNMAMTRKKGMVARSMAARLAGVETSSRSTASGSITAGVDAPDDEPLRGRPAATRPRAAARPWRRPAAPGGATRRG